MPHACTTWCAPYGSSKRSRYSFPMPNLGKCSDLTCAAMVLKRFHALGQTLVSSISGAIGFSQELLKIRESLRNFTENQ